jgi:hypothetical protein
LTDAQREQFIQEGFVKLERAFPADLADQGRAILWSAAGCDPHDQNTWTRPVVRLADFPQEPFRAAVNQVQLHAAFDELVGVNRWMPRESLGGFLIRFPHPDDPGDTGWHVDASFAPDDRLGPYQSYLDWRINLQSKGRALLMLFLFSDVGEEDAPTRIRIGSHLRIPKLLAPAGENGLSAHDLGSEAARSTAGMPETTATGAAGTVYLCHPFLVHAAQPHRGVTPRFLAQPPLSPRTPLQLERSDGDYSLVEKAILLGLNTDGDVRTEMPAAS